VRRFREFHPTVSVNLFDLSATHQAKALQNGELEVGFIGFEDEARALGLRRRKVGECRFVAALPTGHRLAGKQKVSLKALSADGFIVISEDHYPGAHRVALEACRQAGFRPRILQTAERGHTILGMVPGRCGVALLPEPLSALPHPGVLLRPLADPLMADLFVAWRTRGVGATARRFLELADV